MALNKAITLRMFPVTMPTLRRLELARDAGFTGVEINLEPWQEYTLDTGDPELADLRRRVERLGMVVTAVYDREQWHFPMSSIRPATRDRCATIIRRLIHAATVLGADTVLIMPGAVDNGILAPQPEITPYADAYRNAQATLLALAPEAESQRVTLAAENCPGKFLISPLEFARFLDEIGSPRVRMYFDIGNVLWYGMPEHWIPVLGERIHRVHVKDNHASGGAVTAAPLLSGDVNWPSVRAALAALPYHSWLTAEVLPAYRHHGERLIWDTSAAMDAIFGEA